MIGAGRNGRGKQAGKVRAVLGTGIAILVMLSFGCTSYINSIRAELEGKPLWVIQEPAYTIQKVFFTGSGIVQDMDLETARQYAIDGILEKLSVFLKYSVADDYRRELYNTSAIEDLALTIDEEYMENTNSGDIKLHLLASSDRKVISQLVRTNLETSKAAAQLIDQPVRSAESAYNRKQDITALSYYIDAAIQAYISPLENADDQYRDIMDRVLMIVRDITISSLDEDPEAGRFTFEVKRGNTFFAPKLSNVYLKAEFPVKNSTGVTRLSSISLVTGNNGKAVFSTDHPGFRGEGVVSIYLEIDSLIEKLEAAVPADEPLLLELRAAAAEIQYEFPFSRVSQIAGKVIALSLLEYNVNGSLIDTHPGLEQMIASLATDGIQANPIILNDLNAVPDQDFREDDILSSMREAYEGFVTVSVLGSVGISSVIQSGQTHIATAKGSVQALYLDSGNRIDSSGTLVANGNGATRNDAIEAALTRFGELAAASILGILL